MATNPQRKPIPKIILSFEDDRLQISIQHWEGMPQSLTHGIEYKVDRALQQWRAEQLAKDKRAA